MSVTRPATGGCLREEPIGGDGVQMSVRRPHPDGSGRPDGQRACPARYGEVLEVPTGRSRVRRGPTSGSGAEACLRHRSGRWMSVAAVGQWVSASNSHPSALAGRPGALLGGRASIKNSKDTSR